jgi:hypothetical protein
MIDYSKPVCTKSGKPVTVLTTDAPGVFPVIGWMLDKYDDAMPYRWQIDGSYLLDEPSWMDLIGTDERKSPK